MSRQIILYETENGACPVAKFLRKQTPAVKDAIAAALNYIEQDTAPNHLFQKMVSTDGLWEVRIRENKNIYRMLSFFDGTALVVVASAFQKKTQKTPKQEIKTAEARKKDYFRRKENG